MEADVGTSRRLEGCFHGLGHEVVASLSGLTTPLPSELPGGKQAPGRPRDARPREGSRSPREDGERAALVTRVPERPRPAARGRAGRAARPYTAASTKACWQELFCLSPNSVGKAPKYAALGVPSGAVPNRLAMENRPFLQPCSPEVRERILVD